MLKIAATTENSLRTCNEINSRSSQPGMAFPYKWDGISNAYFSPSQVYFCLKKIRFWAFFTY